MNINATLIVQVINFSIVYYILRTLLFKPVITFIDIEHANKVALNSLVCQQRKSIEIQEQNCKQYWHACREYFILHRPVVFNAVIDQKTRHAYDNDMASIVQESTLLAADVYTILEDKIKHVH